MPQTDPMKKCQIGIYFWNYKFSSIFIAKVFYAFFRFWKTFFMGILSRNEQDRASSSLLQYVQLFQSLKACTDCTRRNNIMTIPKLIYLSIFKVKILKILVAVIKHYCLSTDTINWLMESLMYGITNYKCRLR